VAIEAGDASRALNALHLGVSLAESLRHEPVIISQLVRYALQEYVLELSLRLIERCPPTAEQFEELEELLVTVDVADELRWALIGERAMTLHTLGFASPNLAMADPNPLFSLERGGPVHFLLFEEMPFVGAVLSSLVGAAGIPEINMLTYLDIMSGYIAAQELPFGETTQVSKKITAELDSLPAITGRLSHLTIPSLVRMEETRLMAEARLVTARAAVAVEMYYKNEGRVPYELAELVPVFLNEIPPDPANGKPLNILTKDRTYVVYSTGTNGKDDRGAIHKASSGRTLDIGWELLLDKAD